MSGKKPSPSGQCHQLKEPVPDFPVIANQSADWCGNPFPLQRPDFAPVTKEKTDCHVAALLAMTVVDGTPVLKLMTLPFGEGGRAQARSDEGRYAPIYGTILRKSAGTLIRPPAGAPSPKGKAFYNDTAPNRDGSALFLY